MQSESQVEKKKQQQVKRRWLFAIQLWFVLVPLSIRLLYTVDAIIEKWLLTNSIVAIDSIRVELAVRWILHTVSAILAFNVFDCLFPGCISPLRSTCSLSAMPMMSQVLILHSAEKTKKKPQTQNSLSVSSNGTLKSETYVTSIWFIRFTITQAHTFHLWHLAYFLFRFTRTQSFGVLVIFVGHCQLSQS